MTPCSRDMKITNSAPDLHSHHHLRRPESDSQLLHHVQSSHFDPSFSHDDFFEQMLSTVPSCSPWELDPATLQTPTSASTAVVNGHTELGDLSDETPPPLLSNPENVGYQFDESANLASKLRGYQISETAQAAKVAMMVLQQQLLMSRGMASSGDSGLLQMPLSLDGGNLEAGSCNGVAEGSPSFKCPNPVGDSSVPSLYNGFTGHLHGSGPGHNRNRSQPFHHPQGNSTQTQNYGVPGAVNNPPQATVPAGPGSGGATPAQPRQRVRARRGQATDPHSIAERLRRERIAERMKALQELVPNANKTDKASMLDEIIDYVKFLQLQVKVLSMSRLGGATAPMTPFVADISSEGGGDCVQSNGNSGAFGRTSNGAQPPSSTDTMTVTEHQVAKLMEEDMGSAMQYLQGKGLCLMPISLATAISTATCHSRNPIMNNPGPPVTASNGGEGPTSPSMSVLTVQSATLGNGAIDRAIKDAASVSKP